jgi:hypothetical protein
MESGSLLPTKGVGADPDAHTNSLTPYSPVSSINESKTPSFVEGVFLG